jgi:hypothetical protein
MLRLIGGEQKEMSTTKKSQRTFISVTMITVVALATVFIVYAAILATYMGSDVTVNTLGGTVGYSITDINGPYSAGTISINNGTFWYASLSITGAAAQIVKITWTLQCSNNTFWTRVVTPSYSLAVGPNTIYATIGGDGPSGNYNWGQDTDVQSGTLTYQVKATVETV